MLILEGQSKNKLDEELGTARRAMFQEKETACRGQDTRKKKYIHKGVNSR